MSKYYSIEPTDGMTRMCLDPWGKALIKANGDVWLCCNGAHVGNVQEEELSNILNNQAAQEYRRGLLEGRPLPACKHCVDRKACSIEELKTLVRGYYANGNFVHC